MWCVSFETCVSVCMNFSSSYICLIIYFYSKKFFFEDIKNKLCCFHLDDFLFKKFSYKKIHILFIFSFLCVFSCFFGGQRKKVLHSCWLKLRKRVDIPQRVSFTFVLFFLFSRRCSAAEREKSDRAKKIEIFSPNLDVNTPKPPPNASALEHLPAFIGRRPTSYRLSTFSPSTTLQTPLFASLQGFPYPLPPWLNSRGFGVFIGRTRSFWSAWLRAAPAEL